MAGRWPPSTMSANRRTWLVPEPLQDSSLGELTLRIEARTGLRMDKGLAISMLNGPAWRERLEELGRVDPAAMQLDDGPAWHEPMIREAEQNGNAFAAIWHLDRLIAARPGRLAPGRAPGPRVVPVRQVRQVRRRLPAGRAAGLAGAGPGLPGSLRQRMHHSRALGRGPLVPRPFDRRAAR